MRKRLTVLLAFVMMTLAACDGKTPHGSTAESVLAGDSSVKAAEASAAGKAESGTELKSNSETDPDADSDAASDAESETKSESVKESDAEEKAESKVEQEGTVMLQLVIGETPVAVTWEENESVEALKALCQDEPLVIDMSMYGGFEQVGPIGTVLPRNDVQTTTDSGDIVLYSGNQIVVFYGSNVWAYTRLGHITDRDEAGMEELLGHGNVTITIRLAD